MRHGPARVDIVAPPTACPARSGEPHHAVCELAVRHDGPHYAVVGRNAILRWDDVTFRRNYIEEGSEP